MTSVKSRILLISTLLIFAAVSAFTAQAPQKKTTAAAAKPTPAAAKTTPAAVKKAAVEAPQASAGVKYDSGNHPDPFFNPNLIKKNVEDNLNEELPRGQAPPGIAGMYISQVKLLGTVAGGETPSAVFLGTDQRSYFLQESDKLFDGFVKQINADSVVLVRETRFRSGKITTQEITKRLRTP